MSEMDLAIQEFLVESDENLNAVERDLVDFEGHPEQGDTLASIFRAIHTIKGTCSFLGYSNLENLAHVGETLLSLVRDGEITLTNKISSALLSMVDAVRQMLASIERTGNDGAEDYAELKAVLVALQDGEVSEDMASDEGRTLSEPLAIDAPSNREGGFSGERIRDPEILPVEESPSSLSTLEQNVEFLKVESPAASGDTRGSSVTESSIRVDVGLLDKLMNMVGELVLTRNQIGQGLSRIEDPSLLKASQRLSVITTELQEGIMKTRMQPIGNIWSKFPRVVRDLAISCGKDIRIEMEGKETELDKTLIEAIKDPLTHLVRNSVDHGIEAPAVREERGKSREGVLFLRAFHEGGQVNIEVSDDGGGINVQRVVETAIKKGLVTKEQAEKMVDRELLSLIFQAGFSTADKVTNVSGRGVGMDVVKTNIEKIGGTIDIVTELGKGTTFKVKVPLTLAIIPALIVTTAGERFAIPQVSLLELVRVDREQGSQVIEVIHDAPVFRSRGQLLPLVYLNTVIGLDQSSQKDLPNFSMPPISNIVVLQADTERFGLVVDEVNDTEEIVVKPLGQQLKGVSIYAGATIMGDGKVALILDVAGLAAKAKLGNRETEQAEKEDCTRADNQARQTLLLVQVGSQSRVAIPISHIARLEEMSGKVKETAGGQQVVQYRGAILPILRLNSLLAEGGITATDRTESFQMVVVDEQGRQAGIMVDKIIDIVDVMVSSLVISEQPGILGSAVVQGYVTDILDVNAVWRNTLMPEVAYELPESVGV